MSRKMPKQGAAGAEQARPTPWFLVHAVERMLGRRFDVDLAALPENAKAPRFITPEQDSLTVDWSEEYPDALAWLNPVFDNIRPWAKKCMIEGGHRGLRIVMLTPASVGAKWFVDYVHKRAAVLSIYPRFPFEGCEQVYPKDCMLSLFGFGETGFDVWHWKETV